ncbi:MAG: sigma-54-dependent Fis family transcriptional regulator [Deltaproteobacteria bacterium]|nr:sigma-54-dependent Fis family transcriptional regulator [Deltaproteobacteria bacterium]
MKKLAVLIVDDDSSVRKSLELILKDVYEICAAKDGAESLEAVRARHFDIILMDVNLPGMDGLKTLEKIKSIDGEAGVIMLSASDNAKTAVSALKKGAYDYVTKPFDSDDLLMTLKRYVDRVNLKNEVDYLKEEMFKEFTYYGEILSASPKMKEVLEHIESVIKTSSNVLITGESGTGKELVARAIYSMGERKDKPFVAVNCGAVPSELMESELFGHERGAFTGAIARKIGKFEYADGGTIFFDEVATLPMHLQIKLLRALQEKTFERVGGNVPIKVDIRVIAATNVDLEQEVKKGRFREDLYYRLKVVPIELPPLRERKEDIPLLAEHFLKKHCAKCRKAIKGIAKDAMDALCEYEWPGNVRELENLMERLVVIARDGAGITYKDLPVNMFCPGIKRGSIDEAKDFHEALICFERHYIVEVLNKTNWNKSKAARHLNIHRNTLLMKMKSLGIKQPIKNA